MDITKTRTELIREAADKLNIVGTGQALEAEYSQKLDDNVDPLFMQLAADGICVISNDGYIPAEWFDSLAGLLANICAPLGGKAFDPRIKEYYEIQLKRTNSARPSYSTLEIEYF
jgi:hypothetical protein